MYYKLNTMCRYAIFIDLFNLPEDAIPMPELFQLRIVCLNENNTYIVRSFDLIVGIDQCTSSDVNISVKL